ncbi:hypothetical protein AB0C69_23665, partial [Actinomadura sp. NPDC048032]
MTENDGTQGPQRPMPEDEGHPRPPEGQEPPARPLGDRTVVFGAPQLGGRPPAQPAQPREEERQAPAPPPPTMVEQPMQQFGEQPPPPPPYGAPQEQQPQYGQQPQMPYGTPPGPGGYPPPQDQQPQYGQPQQYEQPQQYGQQPEQSPWGQQPEQPYGQQPPQPPQQQSGYPQQPMHGAPQDQQPQYGQPPYGEQPPRPAQPQDGGGERTLIVPGPAGGAPEQPQQPQRPVVDDQATLHWSPGTDIPVATGPERRQEPPAEPWQAPTPPSTPEPWSPESSQPGGQQGQADHERTMMVPPPESGYGAGAQQTGPSVDDLYRPPGEGNVEDARPTEAFDPSAASQGRHAAESPGMAEHTRLDMGQQQWGQQQAQQPGYGQAAAVAEPLDARARLPQELGVLRPAHDGVV